MDSETITFQFSQTMDRDRACNIYCIFFYTMNIFVLPQVFAVYRLPSDSPPPSWLFEAAKSDEFYSITKTSEELSIVCCQENIPQHDQVQSKIEKDWTAFKVEGPLEFELTGILAAVAKPLADAGIPIFTISTFNTDYILVKKQTVEQAKIAWENAGHTIISDGITKNLSTGVRDGPAISFEADPLVAHLVEDGVIKCPTFFLVFVAGWPPDLDQLETPYSRFRQAVEECWDQSDLLETKDVDGNKVPAPVYIYPVEYLHVTVATFYRRTNSLEPFPDDKEQQIKINAWKQVVQKATQLEDWPTAPLKLCIESCQIGIRAGILLWKETTGGMEAMRRCLKTVTMELDKEGWFRHYPGVAASSLDIPGIIHSTFLRFYSVPTTPGQAVQKRFREKVVSHLSSFFPDPIEVPVSKLVCEKTPYMHIPHDDQHVFATSFFSSAKENRFVTDSKAAEKLLADYRSCR